MLDYILDRLQEPSTWRGIVLLLTALGVSFSPDAQEAIISVGLSIAGLIGILTKDQKTPPAPTEKEIEAVQQDQEKKVEKIIKEKKNAKSKKSVESSSDADFFGDGDGSD